MTRAAITHHFGTKEALLREVVVVTDALDASAITAEEPATGMDRLISLRSWSHVLISDPGLANLSKLGVVLTVEAFDLDYPAREAFVNRHQAFRKSVKALVESGQRDGSVRADVDASELASEIIAFMQGAGIQWFLDPSHFDVVSVYDGYFDRLVAELSPPASSKGRGSSLR